MKFREGISKTLTGLWEGWYTVIQEQKTELSRNKQQCPKLNGKSESCGIYLHIY